MLIELVVENIAIIQKAQISFGPGFTALTGETGAGKSLLIDALNLVLGSRADYDLIREGDHVASIYLVIDLSEHKDILEQCAMLGIEIEDGKLYIQRELEQKGRSSCRFNGKLVPVSLLKTLGDLLVDLHGQHEHQSLWDASKHLEYLDRWIGDQANRLKEKIAAHYLDYQDYKQKIDQLENGERERAQRVDMLRFQIEEIEEVGIQENEISRLEIERNRLQNSANLTDSLSSILQSLDTEEGSALEKIAVALRTLQSTARLDPELESRATSLETIYYQFKECVETLKSDLQLVESNPVHLDDLNLRIDLIKKLFRKYGDDESSILTYLVLAKKELEELEHQQFYQEEYHEKLHKTKNQLKILCDELHVLREIKAKEFSNKIEIELKDLAMSNASFKTKIESIEIGPKGSDLIEFLFSANLGEEAKPLRKIASGGEISRVMLALKVVLAGCTAVPTMIFDEIDTGLSGRAAATVASKLSALAEHYQVIVISHLPQIASAASMHYKIEKTESHQRTKIELVKLKDEERVLEIGRMIAGEKIGESAMIHARELLSHSS